MWVVGSGRGRYVRVVKGRVVGRWHSGVFYCWCITTCCTATPVPCSWLSLRLDALACIPLHCFSLAPSLPHLSSTSFALPHPLSPTPTPGGFRRRRVRHGARHQVGLHRRNREHADRHQVPRLVHVERQNADATVHACLCDGWYVLLLVHMASGETSSVYSCDVFACSGLLLFVVLFGLLQF